MYHLLVYVIKEIKVVTKELSSIMHKSYQKEKIKCNYVSRTWHMKVKVYKKLYQGNLNVVFAFKSFTYFWL